MSRRNANHLVVIYWRDIPAQVNAQVGRERHQIVLPARFQRSIDRAKRKAGIVTADGDVAQWRRETKPLTDTPELAAQAEADRLIEAFPKERLGKIAYVGGWEADVHDDTTVSRAELAALEELEEETP